MKIEGDVKVKDLLPLGSVVTLKGSDEHRLMITEYFVGKTSGPDQRVYDYQAIEWNEGYKEPRKNVLFNHNKINHILFYGYVDDESIKLMKILEKHINESN